MVTQLGDWTYSIQLVAIADPIKTDFRDVVEGYLSQLVRRPAPTHSASGHILGYSLLEHHVLRVHQPREVCERGTLQHRLGS